MSIESISPPPVLDASLAVVRRWPSEDAQRWVEQFVHQAAEDPRLCAVVVYGSAVRDVSESSDVDLLCVYAVDEMVFDAPPMDVDLRAFQSDTVDERVASGDEVLGWSLRLGIPLFERDGYWTRLQASWTGRLPLPSAAAAEERAARALNASAGLSAGGDEDAARELRLSGLTQRARARLIRSGVFPLSRPELPQQLGSIGERGLASELHALLSARDAFSEVEDR
jgi:predicted nucleotidyltransferase